VVHGCNVVDADYLLGRNMTEHRNLLFRYFRQRLWDKKPTRNLGHPLASALAGYEYKANSAKADQIRQQSEPAQGVHSRLCRLCLLFSMHIRYERDMDERKVLVANAELELPHRLYKGRGFDITNRSAQLSMTLSEKSTRLNKREGHTSTMQRSGSSPVSSTGILDTLSIQS
jgi:hypothetical protein